MTKGTRGNNRNGRRGNPNQDVQPWLGWIAAMLVVVIVVVAVALGMERTNNQRSDAAEVRMTPLVGGMELPVATGTGGAAVAAASEVTPVPEVVGSSDTFTMVSVITATDGLTISSEMSPSVSISDTESMTGTTEVGASEGVTASEGISATVEAEVTVAATEDATVEATDESTVEPTATGEANDEATVEPTTEPTATATLAPTATTRPTATSTVEARNFEVGDIVVSTSGRAEIHADAAPNALVLDSVGTGIVLEVLVPSGDFESYPVVVDGFGWVRVRAEDGLVGWVRTDLVEAQ